MIIKLGADISRWAWHLSPWRWATVVKREFLVQTPSQERVGGAVFPSASAGDFGSPHSPLCSACSPQVTLTPLGNESPKGDGGSEGWGSSSAAREHKRFLCGFVHILSCWRFTSISANIFACRNVGRSAEFRGYPGLGPDVLWNWGGAWRGEKRLQPCVICLNTFGWCLWSRGQAGRPVPHSPWINLLMHWQKVDSGYISTRNHKAEALLLESWIHQVGKQNLLECQCGTGEQLGTVQQHSSGRSQSGNMIQSLKGSPYTHPMPNICEKETLAHK